MEEVLEFELIKNRAIKGVIALTSRTFLLQILAIGATFLLTIFLQPEEFGVFFVVSAVVNFLIYFSDIGLAAALIQKKELINKEDLKTTFTIQQALVFLLVFLSLMFSAKIGQFYHLSLQGLWLFRALVFSFFLSSLKTIPSIILERGLYFNKLIIPGIIETLLFYITAVILAWQGWGITSFTVAVLVRGFSGLIAIYLLAPWKPSFGIIKQSAKKLLSFGVPFQLNSLLALVKDDLLIAYLGRVLTFSQVGYLGWGQKWAFFPLRFFMDSINKVTFPAYSRIQHQKKILGRAIEKSIYFISLSIFPTLTGLMLAAPYFVSFFPQYQKWQPALIPLAFFCINALFASISTTLTNALNATGKIKTTLQLMVFWTTATWVLTILFIKWFGYNGVAFASAAVAATSWITVIITQKIIPFKFFANIKDALFATVLMGTAFYLLSSVIIKNMISLGLMIFICVIFYISAILFLGKKKFFLELKTFIK